MGTRIRFYRLSSKFVNERRDIPENAQQVLYYTLAVGHHVGVMDCFTCLLDISAEEFMSFLDTLPESPGRKKLEGVLTWGEIEINKAHVGMLAPLINNAPPEFSEWTSTLAHSLLSMEQEPAFYLMVKKYEGE